jgi:hypothetical protein
MPVAKRCGRLALARMGLVADVVNRTDPGEEVEDLAIHAAHIAELMPVPARDDNHVRVRVPVHVVDETGRERQVVEDQVIGPRERLTEKVSVDLMAGDVPPGEHLLLDLTDVKQLHF